MIINKSWFGSKKHTYDDSSNNTSKKKDKSDVFDSYTNNAIKTFVVNHHIENSDDRNMDINDLKIVYLFHTDSLKQDVFNIEKLVIDEKTKSMFIGNENEIEIKRVDYLSFNIMYDDVYIDNKNINYMSVTTSSRDSIESHNSLHHGPSNIYFTILKTKGIVFGLISRLEENTLIIHPTIYVPLSRFPYIPFGSIGFVALDSIENNDLLDIISNHTGVLADEFDYMDNYELDRIHSHNRLKKWYTYIPRIIVYKVKSYTH